MIVVGGRVAGNSGLMRLLTRGVAEEDHRGDGNDDGGRQASSGVYMARFRAADRTEVRRMTLLK